MSIGGVNVGGCMGRGFPSGTHAYCQNMGESLLT